MIKLDPVSQTQINQCVHLLQDVFKHDLLGVYLYGSAVVGGLQKYSDIDLFVVVSRPSTLQEKTELAAKLLKISGVYMKSSKRPIELTIVVHSDINPWHYPPHFDFQYGDWLRDTFESAIIEPWSTKEMPDLALLITQVLLANKTVFGDTPEQLLCDVPYSDFINALTDALDNLMEELATDTRNVLLTLARIWSTLDTNAIRSKSAAADWVMTHLPHQYHPVMNRAKAICQGEEVEHWDDIQDLIKPCAELILSQIDHKVSDIQRSNTIPKSVRLAELDN